jgi:hypothetical protein
MAPGDTCEQLHTQAATQFGKQSVIKHPTRWQLLSTHHLGLLFNMYVYQQVLCKDSVLPAPQRLRAAG